MTKRLALLLWVALALCGATAARAQQTVPATGAGPAATAPANPGGLTPAEAQRALELLQNPQKRAQLIETLQAIATASPPPPKTPAAASAPAVALAPNSLGAQLLSELSRWPARLAGAADAAAQAITDFPLVWGWAEGIAADPGERAVVLDAIWRLAVVVGFAVLLERLARRGLAPSAGALAAYAPDNERSDGGPQTVPPRHAAAASRLLHRLPFAVARLGLDLVPVGIFWAAGSLLAGIAQIPLTRIAILVVVNAYAANGVVMAVGRMLVSPAIGRLRLLQIGDDQAAYLMRWLRLVTIVAVSGTALADLAALFGLYQSADDTLIRAVALAVAVLLGVLVLRCRRTVALWLRAGPETQGGLARWRNWLAGAWHYLALTLITAGWIVWAAGIRSGLGGLRLLIGSIALIVAARLLAIVALGMIERAARPRHEPATGVAGAAVRAARYHALVRFIVTALIAGAAGVALLQFWGADAFWWFAPGRIGARLVSALMTIAVAAVAAIIVWEGANAALDRRLSRLSKAGSAAHSARLRTLLPILRAALLSTIIVVVGLTALSQIGVDIAPLLAGAGIAGIAVGFGAQKLVQDVITGMFVLFENAIQIGDSVTVAGLSGIVERLSVRNIWLRGNDGAVHIIPFSAVTSITNTNRGFGNAAVSVTVAYQEDSERVSEVLIGIAAELHDDPAFAPLMLGDLQLWVDAVKASGVTLAGQIACTDAGRWPVQHEFNRRLQQRFQELGIELGYG